jgi:hypothetical protein
MVGMVGDKPRRSVSPVLLTIQQKFYEISKTIGDEVVDYSLKGCTLPITSCNFSAKPVKLALSPP